MSERMYDGKWGKTIDEWNEWARSVGFDVDFHDPHVLLRGTQERPIVLVVPFTETEDIQHSAPSDLTVENIVVEGINTTSFGVWVCVENRKDDFWVYLNSLVGWGRFSLMKNRFPHMNDWTFELVEVRPPNAGQPEASVRAHWEQHVR